MSKPSLVFREVPGRPAVQLWAAPHPDFLGAPRGLPVPRAAEAGRRRSGPDSATLRRVRPAGGRAAGGGKARVLVRVLLCPRGAGWAGGPRGPGTLGVPVVWGLRGPTRPQPQALVDPLPLPGCGRPLRTWPLHCPLSTSSGCSPTSPPCASGPARALPVSDDKGDPPPKHLARGSLVESSEQAVTVPILP